MQVTELLPTAMQRLQTHGPHTVIMLSFITWVIATDSALSTVIHVVPHGVTSSAKKPGMSLLRTHPEQFYGIKSVELLVMNSYNIYLIKQ